MTSSVQALRHLGWIVAGGSLLVLGIVGLVMPLLLGGGIAIAALAIPLLLVGIAILRAMTGARTLGFSISALGAIVVGFIATTPLRGLRPARRARRLARRRVGARRLRLRGHRHSDPDGIAAVGRLSPFFCGRRPRALRFARRSGRQIYEVGPVAVGTDRAR